MRRRELITLLGGAAASWPLAARAQQSERVRRIGILYGVSGTDLEGQAWDAAFRKRLAELGWIDGRNVHVEYRWTGGNLDRTKLFANELVQPSPDVLLAVTTPATAALQRETHTIPIVFTSVSDPVGSGFVASLRKPGGNITGFINMEASLSGKWVELIHEIAPFVSRMAILFNPQTAPFAQYYLDTFRSAATAFSVDIIEAPVHSKAEIEAFMTKLGHEPGAGIVVMPDTSAVVYRETIISLAERYRIPTIYPLRVFVKDGGLISYGSIILKCFGKRRPTLTAYFEMRNRTSFQFSCRQSSSGSSTSKRLRRSGSPFRISSSRPPIRSSNDIAYFR